MWCSACQQDVPGIAHAATGRMVCSRCQHPIASKQPPQAARICDEGIALDDPIAVAASTPPRTDPLASARHLREISRELRRPTPYAESAPIRTRHGLRRFDPPQNLLDDIPSNAAPILSVEPRNTAQPIFKPRSSRAGQIAAWLIVLAGSILLAAGIYLFAWSLATKQMNYWNLALGLALGGQGTLIFGLVLVVSRLWRSTRFAAAKLQDLHTQLGQLQHTAEALVALRTANTPNFYAELVRGASPHVLLANLKGQLDQLATRLASHF